MTMELNALIGMTPELEQKLKEEGIGNSDQLLEAAKTPRQRNALAKQVGVAARDILELANRADLARVKGIGSAYSNLLEKAGVDTVKELATRRPDNLHKKIMEINEQEGLVKQPPSQAQVATWVEEAKQLPKLLEY